MGNIDYGGAMIERGRVKEVTVAGARVESLTRPGIVTMPLQTIDGSTVSDGDAVFFFEYEDGQGMILARY